jgi:predicted aminopeptidase
MGFYKDFSTPTNEALTDPAMRSRYSQLQMQYRGYDAFNDPMVQAQLKFTSEQREKMSKYEQDWNKSMGNLSGDYAKDQAGATKRFQTMRSGERERLNSLLNPDQQKSWNQMTGQAFDFPPSVYFQSTVRNKDGK